VSDGSAGDGTTQPPATEPPAGTPGQHVEPPAQGSQDPGTDWKAEAQKWEKRAKADAEKAKANGAAAAELEKLRQAQMSENEKAVQAAKVAGMAEARQTLSGQMVTMALRASAAGRLPDAVIAKLADTIDPAKFVTDDFAVDMDAIAELVNGIAPPKTEEKSDTKPPDPRFPELGGQGNKGDPALNGSNLLDALKASVGRT